MAKPSIVPQLTELIGRHKERVLIQAAIEGKWDRQWDKLFKDESDQVEQIQHALREPSIVLYFWGEGGIGKSRLLEGVESILAKCENGTSCRHSGIIDLYDADVHNPREFESLITESPIGKRGFTRYRTTKSHYDQLMKKSASAELITKLREELVSAFVADFNKLSARVRPVICLDTVEVLQYEKNVIEEICGPLDVAVELQNWLIKVIPQLKNAVIILSARPRKELEDSFRQHFGKSFISQEVRGFATVDETKEYFTFAKKKPDVATALKATRLDERVVHKYTNGEPLLVAMVIDLAVYKMDLPAYLDDPWEEAKQKSENEIKEIRKKIRHDLADKVMMLKEDLGRALPYLAWAQKGIDLKMLSEILGWKEPQVIALWDRLQNKEQRPSFIKFRPKSDIVFLHDEMYTLIHENITTRGYVESFRETVCDKLIPYYEQRIKKGKGRLKQRFQVEQLYYKLTKNPRDGYMAYAEMADEAVVGHEVEFVANLETEVRRFFELNKWALSYSKALDWNRINRGFAIRSVRRLLAEERYDKAIEVARKLRASNLVRPEKDPHFVWFLQAFEGEGMAYVMPGDPETARTLQEAKDFLETHPEPVGSRGEFLRLGTLARIYNDEGYLFDRQRRFAEGIRSYEKALEYYQRVKLPRQKADTLRNLADMYARQGELRKAQEHAVQALRDSEEAGNLVGIGLSLNVLARIELAREHPRSALAYSQRALKLFVQAEDIRDQGLAHITIGQAHRKIVGLGLWALKEKKVDSTMRDSLKHLESAKDVFEKKFEPSRLVDVLVQRGCTWRDWATFYRLRGIKSLKVDEMVTNAQKDLEEAVKLAQREKLVAESADAKNDQAEIYFHAGDFDRACQLLDESDSLITADYFINKGKGIPTPSGKTISGFWQILGKNYLVRGRIAFARQQYETAMEQYLLSYLYFQKYSAKPPEFAVRESVANELEKNLDHLPFPKTEILEQLGEYVKKTAEEYHVIDEAATHQILAILEAVRSKEMR